ncbi:hypothetical protein M9H77_27452 [Catharanthus roseus]|uniref:Uncharacterized protein n=1 Tax=Catharanthus roseus TaxID=4058 RepID=A0ACC0ACY2_CATRO|nr:hypothetical protein M9H77_27452 [Catharanthus roseus]
MRKIQALQDSKTAGESQSNVKMHNKRVGKDNLKMISLKFTLLDTYDKNELVDSAKETAMKVNTYLIVIRYLRSRTSDHRPYVIFTCEHGGANISRTKPRVNGEEEQVPIKRRGSYGTKNSQKLYNILAKLKKKMMQGRNTIKEVLSA